MGRLYVACGGGVQLLCYRQWRLVASGDVVVCCRRLDDGTTMATRVTMKMSSYFAWQRRYWCAAISLFDAAEAKVVCGVLVAWKVTAPW